MVVERANEFIELKDASKFYKRGHETIAALDNVNLRVPRGELLAVVGPSGSGKTTLVHIIGGLLTPDRGQVVVDGQVLSRHSDRALSRYRNKKVGFVFQSFSLIPRYTALENVMIPLMIAGVRPHERRTLAERYLEAVGLGKQIAQPVNQLSGGERQRVSIARALVRRPQLIIADEPTGSLDSARGLEIMHLLANLAHRQHITVIVVTHDERLVAHADRLVRIADGKVAQEARPAHART